MITKKTSENAGLYEKLFADASKVLSEKLGTEVTIKTLDEYLFNLETLRDYEVRDEKYSLRFSRLPVDEPPFAIDANARQIEIPASFKKNGVAVIGDHLAEILYFTVDRYYDTWDLLDDDIQVIVQWTHMEAGKEKESGISIISEKDSKVFASEGKVMFGWPINNTIAGKAGSIKFSVRFFKIADGHLVFNMNTIPTTVEVKNGLDFVNADGDLLASAIDDSLLVSYRFKNGLGYQGGEGGAEKPVYVIPLSLYVSETDPFEPVDFGTASSIIMDLNEDGTLSFGLSATGNGNVTYAGYKDSSANNQEIQHFYTLTEDETPSSSKVYYTFNSTSGKYEIASVGETFTEGTDYFEQMVGITADSVGTYWIVTTNTMIPSGDSADIEANWSRYDDKSKEIIVPEPATPAISVNEHAYIEDDRLTITVSGTPGEAPIEGKPDTLVYTLLEEDVEKPITEHTNGVFSVDISGIENIHKYDKTFTASVVATRNGANSAPVTASIRATYPTEAPSVNIEVSNENLTVPTTMSAVITNSADILSDEFTYQWCKVTSAPDDDESIEGAIDATYTATESGRFYCIVTNTVNGKPAEGQSRNVAITAE